LWEAVTQFVVALALALLLSLTTTLSLRARLLIIALAALCGATASFGQMFNWWGATALYALGMSANLLIGWVGIGFILARFTLKPTPAQESVKP
jgi:hypothetical protein